MKKLNSMWMFVGGTLLGVGLTLCIGAAESPAKSDLSRVQMVTFNSGVVGFFEPSSGKIYLYDVDLKNCYQVRQITTLGQRMGTP